MRGVVSIRHRRKDATAVPEGRTVKLFYNFGWERGMEILEAASENERVT